MSRPNGFRSWACQGSGTRDVARLKRDLVVGSARVQARGPVGNQAQGMWPDGRGFESWAYQGSGYEDVA